MIENVPHKRYGADLHAHTTASDGELAPEALLDHAISVGLAAVAITDHDTTAGIPLALAANRDIIVVPGIEISCDDPAGECHILGYFIEHDSPFLLEPLAFLRKRRRERAAEIVAKLARIGIMISLSDREDWASVGRPHLAEALVRGGYVATYQEAFNKYLATGRPAYIPSPKLTPYDAFDMILKSGGVPVLAHPHTFDNEAKIRVFTAHGLLGIESDYGTYDENQKKRWRKLAASLGLVTTAGSDFHGRMRADRTLGGVRADVSVLDELKNKRRR